MTAHDVPWVRPRKAEGEVAKEKDRKRGRKRDGEIERDRAGVKETERESEEGREDDGLPMRATGTEAEIHLPANATQRSLSTWTKLCVFARP